MKMRSMKTKIFTAVICLIVICSLSNVTNYMIYQQMNASAEKVSREYVSQLSTLSNVYEDILSIDSKMERHFFCRISKTKQSLESQMDEKVSELTSLMQELGVVFKDSTMQTEIISLQGQYDEYIVSLNKCMELSKADKGELASSLATDTVTAKITEIVALIDNMTASLQHEVDNAKSLLEKNSIRVRTSVTAGSVIVLVAGILIVIYLNQGVIQPVVKAQKELQIISNSIRKKQGDLTIRIKKRSSDEIGDLVDGINEFMDILQNIIHQVYDVSGVLMKGSDLLESNVGEVFEDVNTTAQMMEQMSAGIEETSATIETISSTARSMEQTAIGIAKEATSGSKIAADINERAVVLEKSAKSAQQITKNMIEAITDEMETAIENSKNVDRITSLTTSILDIASQTNLLSLNASIEAARAGEAGRGFAVVADEIRKLADNSTQTANEIQEISRIVLTTVESMSESSKKLLAFMDSNVLKDYDSLVNIGNQYSEDAKTFVTIFEKFDDASRQIKESMSYTANSIDEIAKASDENAKGIQTVAESSMNITSNVSAMKENMSQNVESTQKINHTISVFTNV